MKIGILLISNGISGAEKVVENIVNQINKKEVFLFTNSEIYNHFNKFKSNVYNLGSMFSFSLFRRIKEAKNMARNLDEWIKKENIKVLSIHLEYSFLVALFLKSKIIIIPTLHGEESFNLHRKLKFLQNVIIRRLLNRFSWIISISKAIKKVLPLKYMKKTVVIPNGVDSKVFKPIKSIKQKKNIILFTGRFIDIKGINEIIAVAKQLPQYEFWFAGQGSLANLINLPNTKNLGFKTTKELVKLYNQANICIFPSYREGFPLCGLEAMSCQKAVIATPIGFSEYIENGKDGIIIPAKDEASLKNAIVDLMTNEKKRKMIEKNARKKVLQYSWDKIAKQYIEMFKGVVKNETR